MVKEDSLRGEERKIVSTRLYRTEFTYFMKLCEGKSVNAKLREIIRQEINKNFGDVLNKTKDG